LSNGITCVTSLFVVLQVHCSVGFFFLLDCFRI
jgi:hypothetical protein